MSADAPSIQNSGENAVSLSAPSGSEPPLLARDIVRPPDLTSLPWFLSWPLILLNQYLRIVLYISMRDCDCCLTFRSACPRLAYSASLDAFSSTGTRTRKPLLSVSITAG